MRLFRQRMKRMINIADLRAAAQQWLPDAMFQYIEGGAEDELTVAANTNCIADAKLLPRALVDVSEVDTSTSVLGQGVALPLVLAPTGMSRIFHPEGERAVAAAARDAGIIYCLSTMASTSIEDAGAVSDGPKCFQIYGFRDRGLTRELLDRARAAGFVAACLTVDVPVSGNRERDIRTGFALPPKLSMMQVLNVLTHPSWLIGYVANAPLTLANVTRRSRSGSMSVTTLSSYINKQFDPSLTWRDVRWMIEYWNGPFAIKGILHPADAKHACEAGASVLVVSNHGGRQLDGAQGAFDALPAVVQAVEGRAEVILDGGVRRGSHIVKALARGATACMVGRPYLYGLAAGGRSGVSRAISILETELRRAMALCGVTNVAAIDGSLLA